MNPDEIKRAVKLLLSLFDSQNVTQEQGALLREEFAGLSYAAVCSAIKEHRKAHEFISIPQLLEGCRAAERGETTKATVTSQGEGSWFDVRRRQNPAYEGRCDIEVAIRVFWRQWQDSTKTDVYRRKLAAECRRILINAKPAREGDQPLDDAGREQWAALIFESVADVRYWLEQLRDTCPTSFMPASVPPAPASLAS